MQRHRHHALAVLAATLALGAGAHAQDRKHDIAKVGAEAAGYNYENAVFCKAPDDLLRAFKASKMQKFAAAGADFEPAFAAGRKDAAGKLHDAMTRGVVGPVSEDALRQSVCVNGKLVEKMRAGLAKP